LLEAIQPVPADRVEEIVKRAQYDGYKAEVENPNSTTETFVSLDLEIDNNTWRSVPINITTGKALHERRTEITLTFQDGHGGDDINVLTFGILPNEGIDICLSVKKPGFEYELDRAVMDFSYQRSFVAGSQPDAYERVLVDAVKGDHTLFATSEEVLASWRILQPVLDEWAKSSDDLMIYPQGSAGPRL
jgi:glucose-6-phosphate 1-dehydrogenase